MDTIYEAYLNEAIKDNAKKVGSAAWKAANRASIGATIELLLRKKDKLDSDDPKIKSIDRAIARARKKKEKYK